MRERLLARGTKTIRGIGRAFKHFDSVDRNHKCDANEFMTGLHDIGVPCTPAECGVSYSLLLLSFLWKFLTQIMMEILILMNS